MVRGEVLEIGLVRSQRVVSGAGASGGLNLLVRAVVRLGERVLGLLERRLLQDRRAPFGAL